MWCCCAAFGPTTRGREHQRTTGEKARSCWRLHLRLDAIARLLHGPKRRCTSRLGWRQFFGSAVSSHPGTQRGATHGERCVPLTPTLARPRPKWLISRAPKRLILRPTGAAATTCAQPGDSSSSGDNQRMVKDVTKKAVALGSEGVQENRTSILRHIGYHYAISLLSHKAAELVDWRFSCRLRATVCNPTPGDGEHKQDNDRRQQQNRRHGLRS